jgi:tRNA (mo5U34)-methyltransferase
MVNTQTGFTVSTSELIAKVPRWRHRIPLPDGSITPGSQDTLSQLSTIGLPVDLSGMHVLDIGCSDGFYSFECEKRGAARILAVDNYSSVYIDSPGGFDVARSLLRSKVEFLRSDLFALNPATVGQFDVVLFLGVLYHLRHPLLALERLAALCKRQLIMETEVADPPSGFASKVYSVLTGSYTPQMWMEFYPGGEINRDPTTWWAPTPECGVAMLESCGFCDVRVVHNAHRRAVFHAFAPQHSSDAVRVIDEYGSQSVTRACSAIGYKGSAEDVTDYVRGLSIPEFGRLKQLLSEAKGKHWHQVTRWSDGPANDR